MRQLFCCMNRRMQEHQKDFSQDLNMSRALHFQERFIRHIRTPIKGLRNAPGMRFPSRSILTAHRVVGRLSSFSSLNKYRPSSVVADARCNTRGMHAQ